MSIFTNSASRSIEEAHAYTEALMGLLGARDPMSVLRATPDAVRAAIDGVTDDQLSQEEAPGKWSIRHVVQHLADSELVCGYRMRLVLAQDRPTVTGYDQDQWANRLGYGGAAVAPALDDFTTLRRSNLRLLSAATDADLQRVGVHTERGEESVAHMVRMYAAHDLLHLAQLARIRGGLHA